MTDDPSRRRVLRSTGALAAAMGLVGCGGSTEDQSTDTTATDGGSDGPSGGNTETPTDCSETTGITLELPDGSTRCVAPVESDQAIAAYYGYDTETQNSATLADDIEVVDATVTFLYRNTATDELSLVVVHDSPDGGSGGEVAMEFAGVADTEWQVKDDPEPRSSSEVYETPGETDDGTVAAIWGWSGSSSLTDGGALGPLGDSFDVTVGHSAEATIDGTSTSRQNIDRWLFVDGRRLDDPIELATFEGDTADPSIGLFTPGQSSTECEATTISEPFTTDTTLRGDCTYTLATDRIDVEAGATLTIEAGATIEAEQGSRLYVKDGGRLVAEGTESDPIVFRGTERTAGHWNGLRIDTDQSNELTHVHVADGGGTSFNEANLVVGSGDAGTVAIRDCEFTNSAVSGIEVQGAGTLSAFENNRLADNEGPAATLHPRAIGSLTGTSTIENNGESVIRLRWGTGNTTVDSDATWPDPGVPYRPGQTGDWIGLRAEVTVDPGARFVFRNAQGLRAEEGGQLVANGDPENRIEFVGFEDGQGTWNGLRIYTQQDNALTNAVVSDGGGTRRRPANVAVVDARATISDCELTDSEGWGIVVDGESSVTTENNTYGNNAEGDVRRPDGG